MKAKELRLGNFVSYFNMNYKVLSIDKDGIFAEPLSKHCYTNICNKAEPIPLTEEWLLKFGFEKIEVGVSVYFNRNGITIYFDENLFRCMNIIIGNKLGASCRTKVKYVHSLQNLYFALIREELEII